MLRVTKADRMRGQVIRSRGSYRRQTGISVGDLFVEGLCGRQTKLRAGLKQNQYGNQKLSGSHLTTPDLAGGKTSGRSGNLGSMPCACATLSQVRNAPYRLPTAAAITT